MAKWQKEEVRVWRLPADVAFGGAPCVVASYPGDRWATWSFWTAQRDVRANRILENAGEPWPYAPGEPWGKNAEACRNGEMDKHLDPEFGPKAPREPATMCDKGRCSACAHFLVHVTKPPCLDCWLTPDKAHWEPHPRFLSSYASAEHESSVDSKIAYGSKKSEPFRRALTEVWRVALYGQGKHGANNWQCAEADGMHFYEDALWRHLQDRRMGEVKAEDSGCYHLAHLAWNALMLLEMELRGVTNPEWFGPSRRGEG
jgi:hypothetical protein